MERKTEIIEFDDKTLTVAVIRCPHCGEIAAKLNLDRVDHMAVARPVEVDKI